MANDTNPVYRIFGREPAAILSALYMIVSLLSAFVLNWSGEQVSLVNAGLSAVMAVVLGFTIQKDALFASLVNVLKAIFAIALGFGLHMTPENQALVMSAITPLVALLVIRPNVEAPVEAKPVKKTAATTETFPAK